MRLFVEVHEIRVMMMKSESTRIKRTETKKRAEAEKLNEDTLT
jgi:hypothetical protein